MSAMEYAKQKMFEALLPLVGDAPLRKRLGWAGQPLTVLLSAKDDGLTPSVEARLKAIVSALTRSHSTNIEEGAAALDDNDAVKLARDILSLHIEVMGGL